MQRARRLGLEYYTEQFLEFFDKPSEEFMDGFHRSRECSLRAELLGYESYKRDYATRSVEQFNAIKKSLQMSSNK